ncbi:unnamed protein product [Pedinophyceae sp. YPF-701]|nr:unnamed protein product [Pedinophyceae sp. YPF-701]
MLSRVARAGRALGSVGGLFSEASVSSAAGCCAANRVRFFSTEGEEPEPEASERVKKIADEICGLTVLEVADLHAILKKRLRIEAAAPAFPMAAMPAMPAAAPAGDDAPAEAAEEKTSFSVILDGFDAAKKITVIKEVRVATGLGLKEAKELVESVPKPIKEGIPKEEAEALMKKLEGVGAKVKMD